MSVEVSDIGMETAKGVSWDCTDAEFVSFVRVMLGLSIDGPPPFWHVQEVFDQARGKK